MNISLSKFNVLIKNNGLGEVYIVIFTIKVVKDLLLLLSITTWYGDEIDFRR